MNERRPLFVPILIVIGGVILQCKALGLVGSTTDGFLTKAWPLLLIAAGVDLFISYRRLISGLILFFTGAALLASSFLPAGTSADIWTAFLAVWPLLLILYGLDSVFSGKGILGRIVILILLIIGVYALLMTLDIPVLKSMPRLDFSQFTSQLHFPNGSGQGTFQNPKNPSPQPTIDPDRINILLPEEPYVSLDIHAASGKVQAKAFDRETGQLLSGTIHLDSSETLEKKTQTIDNKAIVSLGSVSQGTPATLSTWTLELTNQKPLNLSVLLQTGYLKYDLRGLNLTGVSLVNNNGAIDVMAPYQSSAEIIISAVNGGVRVYIPMGASVLCRVTGTSDFQFPSNYVN